MTETQRECLFAEWSLYKSNKQQEILNEYLNTCGEIYYQDRFLEFLKNKLEIEGHWRNIGLA
ncbi:MAG: hypothetical protein ACWGOX_10605 [Desulforhopalus sp.]